MSGFMKKVEVLNTVNPPKQLKNLLEEALFQTSLAKACVDEITKLEVVKILENYSSPQH